jgi:hypothetical protein
VREDADHREGTKREWRQRRLGTAGEGSVDLAVANGMERLTDGDGTRGARVGIPDRRPGEAEVDGDVARTGACL